MTYVDPFKDLNDTKRKEREALLNHPELGQIARSYVPPVIMPPIISRRDYFAAAALQGLCAIESLNLEECAQYAVMAADQIIKCLDDEASHDR